MTIPISARVNKVETVRKIKADFRTLPAVARMLELSPSTLARIIDNNYPVSADPLSLYQVALKKLADKGYLVLEESQPIDKAA